MSDHASLTVSHDVSVAAATLNVTVLLPVGLVATVLAVVVAAIAARLRRAGRERDDLVRQLAASRAERARLSMEAGFVETVAQGLSSVLTLVETAEAALGKDPKLARRQLGLAARTARENLEETRAVIGALAPRPLTDTSLEAALRQVTARFSSDTEIPASFEVEGAARTVSTEVGAILLRVTQESLTNVREHAGAHRVKVRLAFEPGGVVLEVRDDGRGFDPDAVASLDVDARSENGLGSMRDRVEKIGGRLTVHSALVEGTVVRTEFAG